jgi:pyruvate dehydrogenase E2 component (dihydrolipoamide acetyltransferase)
MTHVITFTLPPTGEFQDKARLVSWQVQPGQEFKCDDVLLEIETDKSVIEIPALYDGKMIEHFVNVDSTIELETPLAKIELKGEALETYLATTSVNHLVLDDTTAIKNSDYLSRLKELSSTDFKVPVVSGFQNERRLISPAAQNLIFTKKINIDHVKGTGPNGRITVADVNRLSMASDVKPKINSSISTEIIKTKFGSIRLRTWEPTTPQKNSPDIVLIHGLFADIEAWASLALSLSRSGQRVLAVDLPNHGESRASVENFDELVDSVSEVLAFKTGAHSILVGHSLGAAIATRLAVKSKVLVHALVLISPLGLGTEIEHTFLKGVINSKNNAVMQRELAKLTHAKTIPSDVYMNELRDRIDIYRDGLEKTILAVSCQGIQQINIFNDLKSLVCPVSILHGKADMIIPWQHALNAPATVALHLIADVGHMPQWEASSLTTEVILRYSKLSVT